MRPWPFRSPPSSRAAATERAIPCSSGLLPARLDHQSLVAYPPRDPGLPVQHPDTLMRDQQELLAMLRLHAALPPEIFDRRFAQPLARVADYVNVLPGSASEGFAGAGGLFRAAVETGFSCFRASDGRIFTGELGVEARHRLERRWRYLCFASGLLFPIGGSLGSMTVMDSRGTSWSPVLEPVTGFASADPARRLFVSWRADRPQFGPAALTGSFALELIGRANVEWLERGSPGLLRALLDIVTGAPPRGLVAAGVVRDMWQSVLARENVRRQQNYGRLTIGSNIAPYLLDALVSLGRSAWRLDRETLYADAAGVYLEWPKAGRDIIDFCRDRDYAGIPETEAAVLFMLVSSGLVEPGVDDLSVVPFVDRQGKQRLGVIVTQPDLLLDPDRIPRPAQPASTTAKPVRPDTPVPEPVQGGPGRNAPTPANRPKPAPGRSSHQKASPPPAQGELALASAPSLRLVEPPGGERGETEERADRATESQPAGADVEDAEPPRERPVDLLPDDLRLSLSQQNGNLLGQLVQLWRGKGAGRNAMQRCEQGAAFEFALLPKLTADPTSFLTRLGELGLLYVSPHTTGKMIYPVTLADGAREAVPCFILAAHTMRRLGLQ
jgi:hypothetical protein